MKSTSRTNRHFRQAIGLLAAAMSIAIGGSRLSAQTASTQPARRGELAPAYTVAITAAHTARTTRSPFVSPTASADKNFVIGRTKGTTQPDIPLQDLLAYQITDPAATGPKAHVVLMTGNHNMEHTGSWAFEAVIDFLISDSPEAAALRKRAIFYVYPLVNPDGRFTLEGRANPELEAKGLKDHNRTWGSVGVSTSTDIVSDAILKDTGGRADYFIDFHSHRQGTMVYIAARDGGAFMWALRDRDPENKPVGGAGKVTTRPDVIKRPAPSAALAGPRKPMKKPAPSMNWAYAKEGLNATAVTAEFDRKWPVDRSQKLGRVYMLALYDVLVAAETENESSR